PSAMTTPCHLHAQRPPSDVAHLGRIARGLPAYLGRWRSLERPPWLSRHPARRPLRAANSLPWLAWVWASTASAAETSRSGHGVDTLPERARARAPRVLPRIRTACPSPRPRRSRVQSAHDR